MKYPVILFLSLLVFTGCQPAARQTAQPAASPTPAPAARTFTQTLIKEQGPRPGIDISGYHLISDNPDAERAEAEAVMQVKKSYPVAMMTKDRAIFERILARDFTFRGPKDFFAREDYINNRVSGPPIKWSVKYENIALQFVGDRALVTYHNVINGVDEKGKPDYTERMSWADVYVKEEGAWKIGAVHLIDYKEELHRSLSQ